ncbi:MAG: FAD-binding oxidoreductase [Rhizobiaceae bacterium]
MNKSKAYPTDDHGWLELLPKRKAHPKLKGEHRAEWVVVGAGFTGLSCARRLGELHPNAKIMIVEARSVGQGASGRNSGFTVGVSHHSGRYRSGAVDAYRRINRINQFGLSLLREQSKTHSIKCDFDEAGFYHAVADKFSFPEKDYFHRHLEALEIDHRVLGQEELEDRLGTSHYAHGVHVANNALVQPAALVCGLADNLPNNVTLFENSPVIEIKGGSTIELITINGRITTDRVVMATNYEAPKLGFLKRRIIGSTLSGSFTRVLDDEEMANLGSLKTWGVLSLHGGGATVRLTHDRRICIRNTAEFNRSRLLDEAELLHRQALHRLGFERRFPQLAHVPFEYSWSGVEGVSRNMTDIFGEQKRNIYYVGGYNGSGVTRGTASGYAMAEYASGGQSELIEDCLGFARPAWIPPSPILDFIASFKVRRRFRGVGLDR